MPARGRETRRYPARLMHVSPRARIPARWNSPSRHTSHSRKIRVTRGSHVQHGVKLPSSSSGPAPHAGAWLSEPRTLPRQSTGRQVSGHHEACLGEEKGANENRAHRKEGNEVCVCSLIFTKRMNQKAVTLVIRTWRSPGGGAVPPQRVCLCEQLFLEARGRAGRQVPRPNANLSNGKAAHGSRRLLQGL